MVGMSNLVLLEQTLWVLEQKISNPIYDFPFDHLFACNHPCHIPAEIHAIARVGAIVDYLSLIRNGWIRESR